MSRRRRWRQSQALRLMAVGLVGVATWLTVRGLAPAPVDPGVATLVAARELPLGSTVGADDVRLEARPEAQRPVGALDRVEAAVGQVVSGPVLVGEVVTTARFRGASQLTGLSPALVAVSLPVDDGALLSTLRPAMTVTVLATGSGQTLAVAARVVSAGASSGAGSGSGVQAPTSDAGGHLVVAVTSDEARAIATALGPRGAAGGFLVTVRG